MIKVLISNGNQNYKKKHFVVDKGKIQLCEFTRFYKLHAILKEIRTILCYYFPFGALKFT